MSEEQKKQAEKKRKMFHESLREMDQFIGSLLYPKAPSLRELSKPAGFD